MIGNLGKIPFCLTGFLFLAACGVTQNDPPRDEPLQRTMDVAKQGVFYNRLKQAEINYLKSYQFALTRDDQNDIENAGYNLAVVQLDMNNKQKAYETVQAVRNELYIRDEKNSPQLDLVEAAILYRLHRQDEALRLLQNAVQTSQDDIRERAYFFIGLIANDQNNISLLVKASQKLDQLILKDKNARKEDSWKADQGELHALLNYRNGKYDDAITTSRFVEVSRRQQIEYRAMVRALVIQAMAYESKGDRIQAANLYIRAGKSARFLKEYTDAKNYLYKAVALQADQITNNLASHELSTVRQEEFKIKENSLDNN